MPTPVYLSGWNGNVTFGSYNFPVLEWTCKSSNVLIETSNTGNSGNNASFIKGKTTTKYSIKAQFDTANALTGETINLKPGATGSGTFNIGDSGKTIAQALIVADISVTDNPNNQVTFDIEANGNGAVTWPT